MILPKKGEDSNKSVNSLSAGIETKMQMNAGVNSGSGSKKVDGTKLETTNLELSQKFQCTSDELYNALTVTEVIFSLIPGVAWFREGVSTNFIVCPII